MKEPTKAPEPGGRSRARTSRDCGPASTQATRWGDWSTNEATAEASAYSKARAAAGRACRGSCRGSETCAYVEQEAELFDEETRPNEREETEYRFRARSKGGCACE